MSVVPQLGISSVSDKLPRKHVPGPLALPFDVECAILDQLSNDSAGLRACSLVCRGWTPIAQRRLFRSVAFRIPNRWVNNGRNEYVLDDFLECLNDSPHLATFMRNLRVEGGRYYIPYIAGFVQDVLCKATHLHTVTLGSMLIKPEAEDDLTGSRPRAEIRTLNVWWCGFTEPDALLHILGKFKRIGELVVYNSEEISGKAAQRELSIPPSTIPVIECVEVVESTAYLLALLRSVLCASSLPDGALRSIQFTVAKPSGVHAFLLPCLQYARNHILSLALDVDRRMFWEYPATFAEPWEALGRCIASCTALKSLFFTIEGDTEHKDEGKAHRVESVENVLAAYVRLLRSLSPSVRSIVFDIGQDFKASAVQDLVDAIAGGEHWGELDVALSGSPELAHFVFMFNNDGDDGVTEVERARVSNALEGVLPKAVAKGVFTVKLNFLSDE